MRYCVFAMLLLGAIIFAFGPFGLSPCRWEAWPVGFALAMLAVSICFDAGGQQHFHSLVRINIAAQRHRRMGNAEGVAEACRTFQMHRARLSASRAIQVICLIVGFVSYVAWAAVETVKEQGY